MVTFLSWVSRCSIISAAASSSTRLSFIFSAVFETFLVVFMTTGEASFFFVAVFALGILKRWNSWLELEFALELKFVHKPYNQILALNLAEVGVLG